MAAVTQTANRYGTQGDRIVVTATFSSPADTNTWDTGLRQVDWFSFQILEPTAAAADAITGTVSGGTITIDVDGTVTSAMARAEGV